MSQYTEKRSFTVRGLTVPVLGTSAINALMVSGNILVEGRTEEELRGLDAKFGPLGKEHAAFVLKNPKRAAEAKVEYVIFASIIESEMRRRGYAA